jgi:hypothetical protein
VIGSVVRARAAFVSGQSKREVLNQLDRQDVVAVEADRGPQDGDDQEADEGGSP